MACEHGNLEIGAMVVLEWPDDGRHGITCVAVDRGFGENGQVVTLEAHASRYLSRPQFHVYDAGTMESLLMTWCDSASVAHQKSACSFVAGVQGPGELDVGTTPDAMVEAAKTPTKQPATTTARSCTASMLRLARSARLLRSW